MGQAKQRGTAQERAESAIQSTIDATLAKIKTVLDRYYQDMPNNFSQAENYFTGYVAAFDIKDGMELEGKESEWAYDGLPTPTALLKLVETELNEVIREDKEFLDDFDPEMYIEELCENLMFFRYIGASSFDTPDDVLHNIQTVSFWAPHLVMINGVWHNTYDAGAVNDDGETVGIRF